MKKDIVVITGSNNKNSKTKEVINKILDKVCKIDDRYSYDNIVLGKLTLNYCTGCDHCFKSGYCKIDEQDDMSIIRKKLNNADIIIFASPVYAQNLSGIMKTFIDRLSFHFHLLSFSKKIGFSLAVASSNGADITSECLGNYLSSLGVKVLDHFNYVDAVDSLNHKTSLIAECIIEKSERNYGYSNNFLEESFHFYKNYYNLANYDNLDNELYNHNELKFWNQNWIKEIDSFQEFAIKVKKRSNA